MSNKEKNKAAVEKFWASVAARDIQGFMSVFADDAIAYDPVNKPPLKTAEDRRAYMQGVFDAFQKIKVNIDFHTPCGDHTATTWTVIGTTADGAEVTLRGVDVVRHNADGKFAELWGYFDN